MTAKTGNGHRQSADGVSVTTWRSGHGHPAPAAGASRECDRSGILRRSIRPTASIKSLRPTSAYCALRKLNMRLGEDAAGGRYQRQASISKITSGDNCWTALRAASNPSPPAPVFVRADSVRHELLRQMAETMTAARRASRAGFTAWLSLRQTVCRRAAVSSSDGFSTLRRPRWLLNGDESYSSRNFGIDTGAVAHLATLSALMLAEQFGFGARLLASTSAPAPRRKERG